MDKILSQYTWGLRTNLDENIIATKDAVTLLLRNGMLPRKQIIDTLKAWRQHSCWGTMYVQNGVTYDAWYVYLFNTGYHHVAINIHGHLRHCYRPHPKKSKAYWYSPKYGQYALSIVGIKRLHELGY